MKVTKAKLKDLEQSSPVANEWIEQNNTDDFGVTTDREDIFAGLISMITSGDSDLLLLEHEDKFIGCLGITKFKSPLHNQLIANEHYFYIVKEYRKGFGGSLLLGGAKRWAKDNGCSHLIMNASNIASDLHDIVCKFYESMGMKKFETSYISQI